MQVAEMMRGTRAVYELVFLISLSVAYVHTHPLQVLPSIPGYIPVYIRHGDQPLEEINPALAEAFHEKSSLSKHVHLDDIPGSSDIDIEEDKADRYSVYPLHVRQVDSDISAKHEEDNKEIEAEVGETKASKEELRKEHRRKVFSKPVFKVNPLTEEEKEALEKYQLNIDEEIKSSNDMYDSNLNQPKSSDTTHQENKEQTFDTIIKVEQPVDEPIQLDSHLKEDPSVNENSETPEFIKEDQPIKELPLPNILSNVHKIALSPEQLLKLEKEEKERIDNQSLEEKSK